MTESQCSVCLEHSLDSLYELECGHKFHPACAIRWFRSGQITCPVCRAAPEDFVDLEEDETESVPDGALNEKDMNTMLKTHLLHARKKICPLSLKTLVARYRKSRSAMIAKRINLYRHERFGEGRYIELRRHSSRLENQYVSAHTKFIRDGMLVLAEHFE